MSLLDEKLEEFYKLRDEIYKLKDTCEVKKIEELDFKYKGKFLVRRNNSYSCTGPDAYWDTYYFVINFESSRRANCCKFEIDCDEKISVEAYCSIYFDGLEECSTEEFMRNHYKINKKIEGIFQIMIDVE